MHMHTENVEQIWITDYNLQITISLSEKNMLPILGSKYLSAFNTVMAVKRWQTSVSESETPFSDKYLLFEHRVRAALRVSDTEVIAPVEALFAPTDPVADRSALLLHLLVLRAEVVAVQTPWQVVPQLREVVVSAQRALSGRGGGAIHGHVLGTVHFSCILKI